MSGNAFLRRRRHRHHHSIDVNKLFQIFGMWVCVRYCWEFIGIFCSSKVFYSLFIDWFGWIIRTRLCASPLNKMLAKLRGKEAPTETEIERKREQQDNNNFIYVFHYLFPDFRYSYFSSCRMRLISLYSHFTWTKTFAAANFLIVCWNSDESITYQHTLVPPIQFFG